MTDERDATTIDAPSAPEAPADATPVVDAEEGADSTRIVDAEDSASQPADSTRVVESENGAAAATQVVESAAAGPPPGPSVPVHDGPKPNTTELADASRRRRRRERDSRAEKTAQRVVLFTFVGLGGIALAVVNSGWLDDPPPPDKPPVTKIDGAPTKVRPRLNTAPTISSDPVEAPSIPALGSLEREGLTIVAEGLPEVIAIDPARPPEVLAGIESCRYAYAIWEFSPNKRFKFMTTCGALEGETLAGAWQLAGPKILMSPLISGYSRLTSEFSVERPSMMVTEVLIRTEGTRPVKLRVKQRVTGMRPGMDGEGWRRSYGQRNTIRVRGAQPGRRAAPTPAPAPRPAPAPSPSGGEARDPVLELLQGK